MIKPGQYVRTLLPLFATLSAGAAQAATSTSTFQVTAAVLSTCQVNSSNIDFGSYDPLAATALSSTGNIQVTCTLSTPYSIGFNAGCTAPNKLDTGEGLRCGWFGLWASDLREECHRARPGQAQAAIAGACGPA